MGEGWGAEARMCANDGMAGMGVISRVGGIEQMVLRLGGYEEV